MGVIHDFPYTNVGELNTDWVLKVVKEFYDKYSGIDAALDHAIEAIVEQETTSVSDLQELQETITTALTTLQNQYIEQATAAQTAHLAELQSKTDSGLEEMQDFLDSMPQDVQEIITDLNHMKLAVENLAKGVEVMFPDIIVGSTINIQTGAIESAENNISRTDYMEVTPGSVIWCYNIYATNRSWFYDENKNPVQQMQMPIGNPATLQVPATAKYYMYSNSNVVGRMANTFYKYAEFIDATLSQAGKAADAKRTGDAIAELSDEFDEKLLAVGEDIDAVNDGVQDLLAKYGTGIVPFEAEVTTTPGYMTPAGATGGNTTYYYTSKIPVQPGDRVIVTNGTSPLTTRYICAFKNDVVMPDLGRDSNTASAFIVQDDTDAIVITGYSSNEAVARYVIEREEELTDIRRNKNISYMEHTSANVAANAMMTIPNSNIMYNKKNCSYDFFANFETFTSVKIGHGTTSLGSSYVEINADNVTVYQSNGSSAIAIATYPHTLGERFSDFIAVNIHVYNQAIPNAKLTIRTNGGQFIQDNILFVGSRGAVFAQPGSAMTNAKLSYAMHDLKQDIYIFGDSYISLNDINRWPYHVMDAGYNKFMLCGYPGAPANTIYPSIEAIVKLARPKFVVWALGMNDPDNVDSVNTSWLTVLEQVKALCADIKCELILATIPNTPTNINYYKNEEVKRSGYKYIDFAKAVNAENIGAEWYTGMLNPTDHVHPTQIGARTLAMRVLLDLPEIE